MFFIRQQVGMLVIVAMTLFAAVSGVCAQGVSIELELSSKKIPLGGNATLTITVNGSQDVGPIKVPEIPDMDVTYLGPSTRFSVVNGVQSSSKAFTYSLFPRKAGSYNIPSFDLTVAGNVYRVEPITVEVVDVSGGGQAGQDGQVSLDDKIFLEMSVPKNEVYLYEPIPLKVTFFVTGLSVSNINFPDIDNPGFTLKEFHQPEQSQKVIDGLRFRVVEFTTFIYPTRTGKLMLGPARTTCNILIPTKRGGSLAGPRGSIFDDDFFESFFGRSQKQRIELRSDEMTVDVLPLPEQGKPEDFSGAVGDFGFDVSVSPTEVKEGDPITLRMTVIGDGNLPAVTMPTLPEGDDFKLYDPQVLEKDNIKKTEQVVIPRSAQITEVPAVRFVYFDPSAKEYRVITRGPFPVTVKKVEEGEAFKVVGLEGPVAAEEAEKFGEDIVFIKDRPGALRPVGATLTRSAGFYALLVGLAVLWLGAFIYYKRSDRIRTDSVYARRLMAPRQAKQGLEKARKLIGAGRPEAFYDMAFKTLQHYLGNKLHLPSGAVTFETVRSTLGERHVEAKAIDDVKSIFDECDMIRYASAQVGQENMKASYERLAGVIDHLERTL